MIFEVVRFLAGRVKKRMALELLLSDVWNGVI